MIFHFGFAHSVSAFELKSTLFRCRLTNLKSSKSKEKNTIIKPILKFKLFLSYIFYTLG